MTATTNVTVMTRGELTTALKGLVVDRREAKKKVRLIDANLFAYSYRWVELALQEEAVVTKSDGCARLAATVNMPRSRVESWYYCGQLMADNRMNPDRVDARSVRVIYNRYSVMSKAEQLKAVDMVKKAKPFAEVSNLVGRSPYAAQAAAISKAHRLMRAGELTKTRAKMELMAMRTFLSTYYDKEVAISVTDSKTGAVLLETK